MIASTIIIPLLSLLYPCVYGACEAYYFHCWSQTEDRPGRTNDHTVLTLLRIFFALPVVFIMLRETHSFCITILFCLFLVLSFPLLHDGYYFITRNKLKPGTYQFGWKHYVNSRAFIDLTYRERVIAMVIAAITYTSMIILATIFNNHIL